MPDISDNTNYSETDAANNQTPPNGWPEGQMPSTVNDCARQNVGALKRFWNRINPVAALTPASGAYTLNTSNSTLPLAYVEGERYSFKALGPSVGGDTFQVNALGAKPIQKPVYASGAPGYAAIAAGDIATGMHPQLVYEASLAGGAGAFVLQNQFLPITQNNAGGISVPGNAAITGALGVTGATTLGNLTVTGTTTTTGGIVGVTNGSNAGAGQVGEYQIASGSGIACASGSTPTVATLNLTAGDWDVTGAISLGFNSITSIQLINANLIGIPAAPNPLGLWLPNVPGSGSMTYNTPMQTLRANLATTTAITIQAGANYSGGSATVGGWISARRAR